MADIWLTYFDLRVKGEAARLLLTYSGLECDPLCYDIFTHSLATCPGVQGAGNTQHHETDGDPAPARAAAVGLHDLLK